MARTARTFKAGKVGDASVCVRLNTRARKENGQCPVCLCIYRQGTRSLIRAGVWADDAEFDAICLAEEKGRKSYAEEREKINAAFDRAMQSLEGAVETKGAAVTAESVRNEYKGILEEEAKAAERDAATLYSLWGDVAHGKSVKTAESYTDAYKRFVFDMGRGVAFREVGKDLVEKWLQRMQKCGLSKTTANMYARALRVVLNEARARGYISGDTKAFFTKLKAGGKDWGAIGGKNSYRGRKDKYLNAETWRGLWKLYESGGEGNAAFEGAREDRRGAWLECLGVMLFMYLANGLNLRDALNLRYDDFYFSRGRKCFRFVRRKVAERTAAEVVFPVLPEIRVILERQGLPEERGGLVFGYLQEKMQDKVGSDRRADIAEEVRLTALYNAYIRNNMKAVAAAAGIEAEPSATYCRHSFATNLTQAGVPKEYISASMGHSGGSVTDNYIDTYSYEQMVEYNRRLLATPAESRRGELKALLQSMGREEIEALLNK